MICKERCQTYDLKYEGEVLSQFWQMTLKFFTAHLEDKAVLIIVTHMLSYADWIL